MQTPIIHQLQRIPYSYTNSNGGLNCFGLVQHIRTLYQAPPLPRFDWALAQYPDERSLPPRLILDLLEQHCQPRTEAIQHLDLLALDFRGEIALGTAVQDSGMMYCCFMRIGGCSAVEPLARVGRVVHSGWFYC